MTTAIVTALLATGAALLVVLPVFQSGRLSSRRENENLRNHLIESREKIFAELVELEESNAARKISAVEYGNEKSRLTVLAARYLEQLDVLGKAEN